MRIDNVIRRSDDDVIMLKIQESRIHSRSPKYKRWRQGKVLIRALNRNPFAFWICSCLICLICLFKVLMFYGCWCLLALNFIAFSWHIKVSRPFLLGDGWMLEIMIHMRGFPLARSTNIINACRKGTSWELKERRKYLQKLWIFKKSQKNDHWKMTLSDRIWGIQGFRDGND